MSKSVRCKEKKWKEKLAATLGAENGERGLKHGWAYNQAHYESRLRMGLYTEKNSIASDKKMYTHDFGSEHPPYQSYYWKFLYRLYFSGAGTTLLKTCSLIITMHNENSINSHRHQYWDSRVLGYQNEDRCQTSAMESKLMASNYPQSPSCCPIAYYL